MAHKSLNIVSCFCMNPETDPVASGVFEHLKRLADFRSLSMTVDGYEVLAANVRDTERHVVVRTRDVVSHNYDRYLPALAPLLGGIDLVNIVNWHEGASAPDRIFCLHTTGDIPSGIFGPADPVITAALARSIESHRVQAGLNDYTTLTEATHWSGIMYGSAPEMILECPVPVVDVEIGSSASSWANPEAARVLACALLDVTPHLRPKAVSITYVGGVHFERSVQNAVLGQAPDLDVDFSHILANQWLVSGGYDQSGATCRLEDCLRSIHGGSEVIVFHDKLKGVYKSMVRSVAANAGLTALSHKQFRRQTPATLAEIGVTR